MDANYEVLFVQSGVAELAPCRVPEAGEGQLLIRTRVSLISPGTERAWFLGLPNTPGVFPQRSGYSNIGEVVQVGPGVEGWSVGRAGWPAAQTTPSS
ncbi:MAG: hypothetical protein HC802_18510 [Caldilineaceae bacterium]|nr:hypothetical protein [Caldilineaceae bacterium]